MAAPHALSGLLRLRTSPELRVRRAYGQLTPDDQYDNLAHIICCEPAATFAFDLEYVGRGAAFEAPQSRPVVQMAFQYSQVVPAPALNNEDTPSNRTAITRRCEPGLS